LKTIIAAEGLTKTFGSFRGVEELDFEINEGEVFGFLGPNGSGKTTTIRLLLGMYRPTAGGARVFGRDPDDDAAAILRQTGYLPGEFALHPRLTGRQHLDFVAGVRGVRDRKLCDQLVERFEVVLDRPSRTLSKGNRQKIGIVLAFLHRPELLILDEPTTGLDPLMQREFHQLLRETVSEGRTVLLSSHELDEVQRVVDRLAIIKEGRLIVTDTMENLRKTVPRTLEFRFAAALDPEVFSRIDGVRVLNADGEHVTLSLRGPLASVLRVASEHDPVDVIARPADLDELFLNYYRDGSDGDSPSEASHEH